MKNGLRVLALLAGIGLVGGAAFYLHPLWFADQVLRFHLWRAGVHSRNVQAGPYRVHYFEAGPSSGQPLVLVHGLGSRGEDWGPMIPGLAAHGFHVYVPDLVGYGRSEKPDVDYSIAFEEKSLATFLQAAHVERADVGGWSMGGWIAMKLALDRPALVDRLVLYDSAGIYFPPTFNVHMFVPADLAAMRVLTARLTPKPRDLPPFVARDVLRRLRRNGWVVNRSVNAMAGGRDLLDFRLGSLHQPTLIVWGGADELIPRSVGEALHRDIANSVFETVPGCGHLAPGECPKPVIEGTLGFLKAQPPMQGGEFTLSPAAGPSR